MRPTHPTAPSRHGPVDPVSRRDQRERSQPKITMLGRLTITSPPHITKGQQEETVRHQHHRPGRWPPPTRDAPASLPAPRNRSWHPRLFPGSWPLFGCPAIQKFEFALVPPATCRASSTRCRPRPCRPSPAGVVRGTRGPGTAPAVRHGHYVLCKEAALHRARQVRVHGPPRTPEASETIAIGLAFGRQRTSEYSVHRKLGT